MASINTWLNTAPTVQESNLTLGADVRVERSLRLLDLSLASLALALLALPLALAWLLAGRVDSTGCHGRGGRSFRRLGLHLSQSRVGAFFAALGAQNWPMLVNVLRGDMALVGPAALAQNVAAPGWRLTVRPGLVSLWTIRCRTAVDYGSQDEADLEYLACRSVRHDLGVLLRASLVSLLGKPRAAAAGRVQVADVAFDNVSMPEAISRLRDMLDGQTCNQVSFVNPACVNIAAKDVAYRRAMARAGLVLPDGIGIKIAGDMLGTPLKQNVNGTDLFPRLCEMMAARGAKLFLLGGQPGVAQRVADVVNQRWPGVQVVGVRDGFFKASEEAEVVAGIKATGADVVLVARGVPVQDVFIDAHLEGFGAKVVMGVGGLFDFVSGRIERAPTWMREIGLEWFYRLSREPGRMWKRYLLGNFTFLARVMGQRLGWRQPALVEGAALLPVTAAAASATSAAAAAVAVRAPARALAAAPSLAVGVRAVVFATAPAASDLPVAAGWPAALLPFGATSLAERTLEQLAQAGVSLVDVVVSDHPEAVRRLLGRGERWGITLRWHLAKDPARPYHLLRALNLEGAHRVLIGHAHRWIAAPALTGLVNRHEVAMCVDADDHLEWTGWASVAPEQLAQVPVHADQRALGRWVDGAQPQHRVLAAEQHADVPNARALLSLQQRLLKAADDSLAIPATWIRTPWGAMSPQARVHPGALMQGPALVGPGCLVRKGAVVGANTVLTSNVVVSSGTHLVDTVVLPGTLLGRELDFADMVVQGRRLSHLGLDVQTVLPRGDALLQDLEQAAHLGRSANPLGLNRWLPRALAATLVLAFAPLAGLDALQRRLRGLPLRWQRERVVLGRHEDSRELTHGWLRRSGSAKTWFQRVLAGYGGLLDVTQGHRSWFGVRARPETEWYALSEDWQSLLAQAPVGWLHAPAWADGPANVLEARAAADAFHAVRRGWLENLRVLRSLPTRLLHAGSSNAAPAALGALRTA